MKAAHYRVQRDAGKAGLRVAQHVDDPGVRAAAEHHEPLVPHMYGQDSFIDNQWFGLPRRIHRGPVHVLIESFFVGSNPRDLAADEEQVVQTGCWFGCCLLYTSDAADEEDSVDL